MSIHKTVFYAQQKHLSGKEEPLSTFQTGGGLQEGILVSPPLSDCSPPHPPMSPAKIKVEAASQVVQSPQIKVNGDSAKVRDSSESAKKTSSSDRHHSSSHHSSSSHRSSKSSSRHHSSSSASHHKSSRRSDDRRSTECPHCGRRSKVENLSKLRRKTLSTTNICNLFEFALLIDLKVFYFKNLL